jgi:predicted nucleic acid-binding protein
LLLLGQPEEAKKLQEVISKGEKNNLKYLQSVVEETCVLLTKLNTMEAENTAKALLKQNVLDKIEELRTQVEELFNLAEMNVRIVDTNYGLTDVEQLALISKFKKVVIANSSYSWWGATLSKDETLVASPKNWYRSMPTPIDLIPENWIQIENSWL